MIGREQILALVPHQGAMCLWDEVLAWDAQSVHVLARNHTDATHPLRRDGRLHALHLCEYGAQAMAVHGGLRAQAGGGRAAAGVLVALRGIELHATRIDELDGALECNARVLVEAEGSQQYAFEIHHRGTLLAQGRAAVMLQPQ